MVRAAPIAALPSAAFKWLLPGRVLTCLVRPADSWWPGQTPDQDARWRAVGNWDMSSPISASTVTATRSLIPGMVRSRSRVGWNGWTASAMRVLISAMLAASWSITCRCSLTRKAWWAGESAGQCHRELCRLLAEAHPGQTGQGFWIVLPGDEGVEDRPPGHAENVGGDRGQFDAGVLEDSFQPVDLTGPVPGQGGAETGQVPQLPDRLRRHERAADQAVGAELGQPLGVGDVSLTAGQVLHVHRVGQDDVERAVLE